MRVVLAEVIAALVALLVLAGISLVIASVINPSVGALRSARGRRRQERDLARLRRARRTTPWRHYARPAVNSFEYEIGIERVWEGHILARKEIKRLPEDDTNERLRWEGIAIVRAQEHNDLRVGMDDPA